MLLAILSALFFIDMPSHMVRSDVYEKGVRKVRRKEC